MLLFMSVNIYINPSLSIYTFAAFNVYLPLLLYQLIYIYSYLHFQWLNINSAGHHGDFENSDKNGYNKSLKLFIFEKLITT